MSWSSKPLGPKMSRMCLASLSPSGRRPAASATPSAELVTSMRPKRVGMSGPPMALIATLAAKAHKSALEINLGTYLSAMPLKSPIATSGRPALAAMRCSPLPDRRMAALGQPSFPLKTPASCHDRRIKIGPQHLFEINFSKSDTR